MPLDVGQQLQMLLSHMNEGETLFDAASHGSSDEEEASCADFDCSPQCPLPEKQEPTRLCLSGASNKVDLAIRMGIEIHEKVQEVIRNASANPAFSFALFR